MQIAPHLTTKSEYRRFHFTYLFGGREWSIEIPALSLDEARERMKVLPFAHCDGEVAPRMERAPATVQPVQQRRRVSWFTRAA
jgi:hypothetical protein